MDEVCSKGCCLWSLTACIHPKGSSGFCALIAAEPWVAIMANPRDKKLYLIFLPESCEDQGSCCSSKTQGVAALRASGRRLA